MVFAILIVYLLVTTFIGIRKSKSNKTTEDFLVAKRSLGTFLVAVLFFGEALSGASLVGKSTESFNMGLSAVWVNWGTTIGCLFVIVFGVNKFYRVLGQSKGIMSVPEAYKEMFDRRTQAVMMVITALVYSIIFSIQPLAAANILSPIFGIDMKLMALIVGILVTFMAFAGGLKGIAEMNIVHSSVMFVGLLIVAIASIRHVGGWSVMTEELPASYFSILQPDLMTVIAWALGTGLSFVCAASIASVAFGARSTKAANRGLLLASAMIIPYAVLPAIVGMAAKVKYPEMDSSTTLFEMANKISPYMGALVTVAVIAAILSTAPSLLLMVSTTLTRDLYKGFIRPNASDAQQLKFSRSIVLIIGVVGTIIGLNTSSILNAVLGAFQIRAFAGVLLIVALFWPRVTINAAFWSLVFGGGIAAIWFFAGNPFDIQPLWPSLIVGGVILVGMTLMSKEKVSPGYRRYQECLNMYKNR